MPSKTEPYVLNSEQLSVLGDQCMQESSIPMAISLYAATVLGLEQELTDFIKIKHGNQSRRREGDKIGRRIEERKEEMDIRRGNDDVSDIPNVERSL